MSEWLVQNDETNIEINWGEINRVIISSSHSSTFVQKTTFKCIEYVLRNTKFT